MTGRARLVAAIACACLLGSPTASLAQVPFAIEVLDSATGRGVPLVEVLAPNGASYYTDSNGIVAFDDGALLDEDVNFTFTSYGYQGFTESLHPTLGGTGIVEIDRINQAERIYRITGAGIYADSVAVGRSVPIEHPLLNANVRGQDSVQTVIHNDRIHWFWGDTLYETGGLGNFRTAGAVSDLPENGGLNPSEGVNLDYYTSGGSAREMMPLPDPGPIWIDGLFEIQPPSGPPRMVTHFVRVESFTPVYSIYEQGLAIFSDASGKFQRLVDYPLDAPITPAGHAFEHSVDGEPYVYFAQDYPNIRVRKEWHDVIDISQWEAFTPLVANTRYDAANPQLEIGPDGKPVYGWKKNTDPLSSSMLEELVQNGHIDRDNAPFGLQDFDTGNDVWLHRASVHWNDYRENWIMIGTQSFGSSFLGEVWFAEAPTPEGPWKNAVKVATHHRPGDNYTFYNPTSHPFFDQQGGQIIYFEGTYANTFSGNPEQTPLYDYNQLMYRLDLSMIPSLVAPPIAGDFNGDGVVDAADYTTWRDSLGKQVVSGTGADGSGNGVVDMSDYPFWSDNFGNVATAAGSSAVSAVPEPAALCLALLLLAALMVQARRIWLV